MPAIRKNKKIDQSVRDLIISWCAMNTKPYAQAARELNLPPSTVKNIVDTFLTSGRTFVLPRGGNRHGLLTVEHEMWLEEQVNDNAALSIKDLTDNLNNQFNLHPPVSQSTVNRAVSRKVGYTLKLLRKEPAAYNDPTRIFERQQWAQRVALSRGSLRNCIFLDEAGFNLNIKRNFGRAAPGRRAIARVPTQRGRNMTLMVAIDSTGVLAHEFGPGGYNSQRFEQFLEEVLFPILGRRRTIVLDNARFHKTDAVAACCRRHGHKLLFLCPYSPHLNAAEHVFSKVKGFVKKQTVADADGLIAHVSTAIERITSDNASGWIRDVHRNFLLAHSGQSLGVFYSNQDHLLDIEAAHHEELARLNELDRLLADQSEGDDGEDIESEMDEEDEESEGSGDEEEQGVGGMGNEEEVELQQEMARRHRSPPHTRSGLPFRQSR